MSTVLSSLNMLNQYATIEERLPRLLRELTRLEPDVFAAQEVLRDVDNPAKVHPLTERTLAEAGLTLAALGPVFGGHNFGNAIFYREQTHTLLEAGPIVYAAEPKLRFPTPDAVFAVLEPFDESPSVIVISAHLSWGAQMGGARLANARAINNRANELNDDYPGALIFLAGDFNEGPAGAAVQYLTGNSDAPAGDGAFWIDIWPWRRPGELGVTQDPAGHYATLTAAGVGIVSTGNIPARRIDYIMVREWAYERLGAAPAIELWGTPPDGDVSDHFGLSLRFGS